MSAPLNARDAKCCCECRHWHGGLGTTGECRHPEKRLGLEYERPGGSRYTPEWQVTGRYATCNLWDGK